MGDLDLESEESESVQIGVHSGKGAGDAIQTSWLGFSESRLDGDGGAPQLGIGVDDGPPRLGFDVGGVPWAAGMGDVMSGAAKMGDRDDGVALATGMGDDICWAAGMGDNGAGKALAASMGEGSSGGSCSVARSKAAMMEWRKGTGDARRRARVGMVERSLNDCAVHTLCRTTCGMGNT